MCDVEEWKFVPGTGDYYKVSNLGRVRSAERTIIRSDGLKMKYKEGRPRLGSKNPDGYRELRAYSNSKYRTIGVHRAVLAAFVGPCPEGAEVCHNNGIRDDNRLSNLRYGTHSENMHDVLIHGKSWQLNTTHCPAGHEYIDRNLVPSTIRSTGSRGCLSCSRANRNVKDNPDWEPFLKEISDLHFSRIVIGADRFKHGELKEWVESLIFDDVDGKPANISIV